MKRKLLAAAIAVCTLVGLSFTSFAGNNQTVTSHGTLHMVNKAGNKEVTIYASDIQYLQNELDALFAEVEAIGR